MELAWTRGGYAYFENVVQTVWIQCTDEGYVVWMEENDTAWPCSTFKELIDAKKYAESLARV